MIEKEAKEPNVVTRTDLGVDTVETPVFLGRNKEDLGTVRLGARLALVTRSRSVSFGINPSSPHIIRFRKKTI